MASFVPLCSFFHLHPQLSPEEKHVGSCAALELIWRTKMRCTSAALVSHCGNGVKEIPKSSFQRGSEAMTVIVIVIIIFE